MIRLTSRVSCTVKLNSFVTQMFCSSEVSDVSSQALLATSTSLLVLASVQLWSTKAAQHNRVVVGLASHCCVVALALTALTSPSQLVVVLGSLLSFFLTRCSTHANARVAFVTSPLTIVVIATLTLGLTSSSYGALIAVELVSLSTLLLIVESSGLVSKVGVLSYYWVSAICTIIFVAVCGVAPLVTFYAHESYLSAALALALLFSTGAKLGAMPLGVWAVWFYESLTALTMATYLGSIYPPLVLALTTYLFSVFGLIGLPLWATLVVAVSAVFSALALSCISGTASRRIASLVVVLTSVTYVFMCVCLLGATC